MTPPAPEPEPEPEPEPVVSVSLTADKATSVTTSGAVLKAQCVATVDNVSVSPTSVGFRYGTAELTNNVSCTADSAGNFTTTLTGLTHSTKYYWNAYAVVNGEEYKLASNRQFTTETPTPVVEVTSVSYRDLSDGYAPTSERAYLSANYTATLDGAGIAPTAVGFCYGTTTTRNDATSVTVTQANLTAGSGSYYWWQYGLQPDTLYYWWAWVEVDGKKYYTSNSKQFTTEEVAAPVTPALGKSWLEMPAAMTGNEMGSVTTSDLFLHTFYYGSETDSNRNYTVCYDKGKLTTYWVAYPLNSSHKGSAGRSDAWAYVSSSLLAESLQPNIKSGSYRSAPSGGTNNYSRGHLLPSNSRQKTETMNKQTFYSVNLVPQIHSGFNGGVWQSLEAALQSLSSNDDLFIVTGTALQKESGSEEIGTMERTYDQSGKEIAVPRYFYKVVLKVNSTSNPTSASAIGFWFTNKSHSGGYEAFACSVDEIEQKLGMDFFVNLPDSIEETAEGNSSWSSFQSF